MDDLVLAELCAALDKPLSDLDLNASFIYHGGHSLSAAALVAACKAKGCLIKLSTVLISPSLLEVIASGLPTSAEYLSAAPNSHHQLHTPISTPEEYLPWMPPVSEAPQVRSEMKSAYRKSILDRELLQSAEIGSFLQEVSALKTTSTGVFERQQAPYTPALSIEGQSIHDLSPSPSPTFDQEEDVLTEMQLSLIHGTLKTPGINIITHSEIYLTKDIPVLKVAWRTIIEMEPIFHYKELLPEDGNAFHWHDPSDKGEFSGRDMQETWDGSQIGCFFEVVAQQTPTGEQPRSAIIWRVHHALIDGFSASLLFEKVRTVTTGGKVQAGPSFSHLVRDLRLLQQSRREEGNDYWFQKYQKHGSAKTNLLLPSMEDQPELAQTKFSEISIDIVPLAERLCTTARETNVTVATFLNAAWALALSKYTDSDTVFFGVVLSGRDLPLRGVSAAIGAVINTLPFFVTIDREKSVKEFLRSVFEDMVELRDFQWTTPENGFSRDFECALALQFGNPKPLNTHTGSPQGGQTTHATEIPLSIAVEADGKLRFLYHSSRFSQQNIERLGACYYEAINLLLDTHSTMDAVMEGLLSCPSQAVLKRYGNCFSGLTTRTSVKQDLVTLFEASTRKFPEEIAISLGELHLTYRGLDYAASKLALRLKEHISFGDVVCVHSDRSMNWIVGIYGILKAGGVYCSLDSGLPPELRNTMYSSAGAKIYLTPSVDQMELRPVCSETCWAVENILNECSPPDQLQIPHRLDPIPWAIAYICFTSGSTGTPKGVMCTHEGLVAFQSDLKVRLFAQPGTHISQIMSPAFDGSIHEIFSTLSYGATLVLQSGGDPFAHLTLVDSAILTPSMARVLNPQDYPRLSKVYLVGEPVSQAVSDKWSSQKELYNMYGPTEGTGGATIKHLTFGNPVTIGGPNPSTRVYILDSRQSLVLPGIIGEIYLAGVQIARGYLNLEDQTRERFLVDSISRCGETMYKTGDRGYWNEQGEIVCLGRNDRQIKLRGYRLDMNDLEIRISRAVPSLEAVAVAPQGDYLVAMVQPASTNIQDVLARIGLILPSYAVPQHIQAVDLLPVTSTGKIDYAAVSKMNTTVWKRDLKTPRTTTEKAIASAFGFILKLDEKTQFTTECNFIILGGHSLLQLSLASYLTKTFKVRIPLRMIIENPKLGALAKSIDIFKTTARPELLRAPTLGAQQVSPIEQEWLQKYDIDSGSACFNVCITCNFDDNLVDRNALISAWNIVLSRHKVLRSRYLTRRGRSPLRVDAECAPQVERFQSLNLWAELNRPFQVNCTSPVRVLITKERIIIIFSHIIVDYTALSILLREASAIYNGEEVGVIDRTYADSSVWYDTVPPCYLDFWSNYLEGCLDNPPLLGRQQDRTGYRGISVVSKIDSSIFQSMVTYCGSTKISLQQLIMAAVAICLQLDTVETDIVIGSPYINRNTDEDLEMVGLFLEPLPVRITYTQESDLQESFVQSVQQSSQAALSHVIPWHQLLDHLSIQPNYPNHPLFDVMVTFHDNRQSHGLNMSVPGFEPCFIWSEGSKFKLMCEVTAISESKVLLRLEHDNECIPAEDIKKIQTLIPQALSLLVQDTPHDELKMKLSKDYEDMIYCNEFETRDFFGMRLCDL